MQQFNADPTPRRVAALRGWRWCIEAFYIVRQQPLTWILLALAYLVIHFAVSYIPVVGGPITFFVAPVFAAGFVLAAHKSEQGGELELSDLFAGFKRAPRQLINVGMLYLGLLLLALLLLSFLVPLLGVHVPTGAAAPQSLADIEGPIGLLLILGAVLVFLVSTSYWFAPALVALTGAGAWRAIRLSLRAGLANWLALLLASVALSALLLLALLPLGLGLLLWFPVMYVTAYTSWRDIFADAQPAAIAPQDPF
ncbi:hypothetical protein CEK28_02205 [Xenophilus sp. AP218F]|nr:hypothetical protein CEK28_02205 [Xenophilus sp. AP218F]